MADPTPPTVDLPDGWVATEETVETVFELPGVAVRGGVRRYEDEHTREALRAATDDYDETVRFLAATRLAFDPGLPPGTLPSAVLPQVRRQATTQFKQRLRDRGVGRLNRGRSERLRVDGTRVRARSQEGVVREVDLPVVGWVAAWHDEDFLVVTGGYPNAPLAEVFDVSDPDEALTVPPRAYRTDVFDALRSVR